MKPEIQNSFHHITWIHNTAFWISYFILTLNEALLGLVKSLEGKARKAALAWQRFLIWRGSVKKQHTNTGSLKIQKPGITRVEKRGWRLKTWGISCWFLKKVKLMFVIICLPSPIICFTHCDTDSYRTSFMKICY